MTENREFIFVGRLSRRAFNRKARIWHAFLFDSIAYKELAWLEFVYFLIQIRSAAKDSEFWDVPFPTMFGLLKNNSNRFFLQLSPFIPSLYCL